MTASLPSSTGQSCRTRARKRSSVYELKKCMGIMSGALSACSISTMRSHTLLIRQIYLRTYHILGFGTVETEMLFVLNTIVCLDSPETLRDRKIHE